MCTVSWRHTDSGYRLYMNRDEKRTRPAAAGPEVRIQGGLRYLAPVDPAGGGTWIAVNERGLTLCLLNGANLSGKPGRVPSVAISRGTLVNEWADSPSLADLTDRFGVRDLSRFAPFTMVALAAGTSAMVLEWDGEIRRTEPDGDGLLPLASSSFDAEGVRRRRATHFAAAQSLPGFEPERDFHLSHAGGPSAYSTCMHREDARTVSFTRVEVDRSGIRLCYQPGSPCENLPVAEVRL